MKARDCCEPILAHIATAGELTKGLRPADIVKACALQPRHVTEALRILRESGRLHVAGAGKHLRYFATAELAAAFVPLCQRGDDAMREYRNDIQRRARARARSAERENRVVRRRPRREVKEGPPGKTLLRQAGSDQRVSKPRLVCPFSTDEVIVPPTVVVQTLPGFTGRTRFEPDADVATGFGSFSDEWRRMRAGGSE